MQQQHRYPRVIYVDWHRPGSQDEADKANHVAPHLMYCTKAAASGNGKSRRLPSYSQAPVGIICSFSSQQLSSTLQWPWITPFSKHIMHVGQRDWRFFCSRLTLCVLACSVGPHPTCDIASHGQLTITSKTTQVRRGASAFHGSN